MRHSTSHHKPRFYPSQSLSSYDSASEKRDSAQKLHDYSSADNSIDYLQISPHGRKVRDEETQDVVKIG